MSLRQAIKVYRQSLELGPFFRYKESTWQKSCRRVRKLIAPKRRKELRAKALRVWSLVSFDESFANAEPLPKAAWGDE
jgi:hypothetical protein